MCKDPVDLSTRILTGVAIASCGLLLLVKGGREPRDVLGVELVNGKDLPVKEEGGSVLVSIAHDELRQETKAPGGLVSSTHGGSVLINGRPFQVEWRGDIKRLKWPDSEQIYAEGRWVDGRRQGVHKSWHPTGDLGAEEFWIDGKRQGVSAYYFEGNAIATKGEYSHGYKNGKWTNWYPDGSIKSVGYYATNLREQFRVGSWTFHHPDGSINNSLSGLYENGTKVAD